MARNRRAFSQIKESLRLTGGVAAPGTPGAGYLDWVAGKKKKNKQKTARVTGRNKGRLRGTVVPFFTPMTSAADFTNAKKMAAYVSRHSANAAGWISEASGGQIEASNMPDTFSKVEAGIDNWVNTADDNAGFYSSQIIVNITMGNVVSSEQTSGITGRRYAYKNRTTVTLPFGRRAFSDSEGGRYQTAQTLIIGSLTDRSFAFSLNPEKVTGQRNSGNLA